MPLDPCACEMSAQGGKKRRTGRVVGDTAAGMARAAKRLERRALIVAVEVPRGLGCGIQGGSRLFMIKIQTIQVF